MFKFRPDQDQFIFFAGACQLMPPAIFLLHVLRNACYLETKSNLTPTAAMSEKDNKTLIVVAVIGLAGTLGAAFISNFDKFFPGDKKEGSQVEKNGGYRRNGETGSNSLNKWKNSTDIQSDEKNDVVDFDKSVLIFKNRKFNEGETITFLDGKFSITIFNSSGYDCKMRVCQRLSIEKENNYHLVNGSPLPISIGSLKYFFHFNAGEYRKYCVITSYYDQ